MLLRSFYLCILLFATGMAVNAQTAPAQYVYDHARHQRVEKYQSDNRYEYLVLESNFSKESVQKIPFTDRRVVKIDLVYSTFSEQPEFNQRQLDIARLESLIAINPRILDNQFLKWNLIGQTGCNTSQSCKGFFHGFVIYYEDYYTKETTIQEIDSIQTELRHLNKLISQNQDKLKIDYQRIDCEYPESLYSSEYLTDRLKKLYDCTEDYKGRVFFEAEIDPNGRPLNVLVKGNLFPCKAELAKRLKYVLQWKRGLIIGRKQHSIKAIGFVSFPLKGSSVSITSFEISDELKNQYKMLQQYSQCVAYNTDTTYAEFIPIIEKRVVTQVLQRNKWETELFVVDVTGSMHPFTADLLKWVKLRNDSIPKSYVFFNDGNDKPTNQKELGHTGGLYFVSSSVFSDIKDKMFEAMRNGGGGDLPENNFEALMAGVNKLNPSGEVVMIADNYSFPRDEVVLARFSGNLKIILCHTDEGINAAYLTLARKYGFSLHTLKSDIIDFTQRTIRMEGQTYQWDGVKYQLVR